jgi:membrane protease subunit HflC
LGESVLYSVNEREPWSSCNSVSSKVASRTKPGFYFKLPMIQEAHAAAQDLQVWHGTIQTRNVDVPTADGKKVEVTVWAVWITDRSSSSRRGTVPNAESRVKEFVRSNATRSPP